jgi:general secretion pathway protein I
LRRSSSATACSPSDPPHPVLPLGSRRASSGRRPGGRGRPGGFTLLEVLVAFAILGIGLGVVFQGIGQGLRLRGESADNVAIALVAERLLGEVAAREAAPETPEEGEEAGCSWRLEPVERPVAPGGVIGASAARGERGAPLVAVRLTVRAASGGVFEATTLLPPAKGDGR